MNARFYLVFQEKKNVSILKITFRTLRDEQIFSNKSLTCHAELPEYSLSYQHYYQGLFHCSLFGNSILSSNGEYLIVNMVVL